MVAHAQMSHPTDSFQHFVFWIVFLWLQFLAAYFWKNSVNKQLKTSAVRFKSNTREFSRRCRIWFWGFYTNYIRYLCWTCCKIRLEISNDAVSLKYRRFYHGFRRHSCIYSMSYDCTAAKRCVRTGTRKKHWSRISKILVWHLMLIKQCHFQNKKLGWVISIIRYNIKFY